MHSTRKEGGKRDKEGKKEHRETQGPSSACWQEGKKKRENYRDPPPHGKRGEKKKLPKKKGGKGGRSQAVIQIVGRGEGGERELPSPISVNQGKKKGEPSGEKKKGRGKERACRKRNWLKEKGKEGPKQYLQGDHLKKKEGRARPTDSAKPLEKEKEKIHPKKRDGDCGGGRIKEYSPTLAGGKKREKEISPPVMTMKRGKDQTSGKVKKKKRR